MLENLIVPVLNRYDLLQRMVNSVDYPVGHLLILDNGASVDRDDAEPLELNDCFEQVTYLPLPANLGVAGSWNLGVKLFPHDARWFFASNDIIFAPGDLELLAGARTDALTLCAAQPQWQAFAVGEEVVRRVGLWDEGLHPAYFEDDDYEWRVKFQGFDIVALRLGLTHDNSSTLKADARFGYRNEVTFKANQEYFKLKQFEEDYSEGGWSLTTRRANEWLDA